jgi:hypothetical protein
MRRAALVVVTLAAGCVPREGSSPPVATDPIDVGSDGPSDQDHDAAHPAEQCGPADARLSDLGFVSPDVRAAFVLDVSLAETDAAVAELAESARGSEHGLPIALAFAIAQWGWQVPALRASLREIGLQPAELLYLRADEPSGAWVFAHACDLDTLRARTTAAWGLSWRTRVEGAVGAADERFAWDLVVLPGDRIAMVARGRANAWIGVLGPNTAAAPLGDALSRMAAAPIRGVITGSALLEPGADATTSDQVVVVDAEGVHVGGSLPVAP